MATTPKQELHEWIDRLDNAQAQRLVDALRGGGATLARPAPRSLVEAEIVLTAPVLPDDETADEMIATVRRWRREGGYA
jgi:hypothetical protein